MMSMQPRITVIMPSFQQGPYLRAALRSVIGQNYPNLELLVYDAGSTDGSVDIIKHHAAHITWWQSQPDGGQVAAINQGLLRATGDVVGWLNSDDVLLTDALRKIGSVFADDHVQAVCGWNISFTQNPWSVVDQRVYPQPTADVLRHRPLLPQETVYWRNSVTDRVGKLDDNFKVRFDTDYWVRMVEAGVVPRLIPQFLSGFRQQPQQKTVTLAAHTDDELVRIFSRLHGKPIEPKKLKKQVPLGWRLRYRILQKRLYLGLIALPAEDDISSA